MWQYGKKAFPDTDEDGTLIQKTPNKKGRAIVEVDLDESYVMTETKVGKREKVISCLIYLNT